jgi:hypothetical protein
MKLYEPHPLALMFPAMNDEAIDMMADTIKTDGLQNPIVLYEDKILDGIQRQEACKRAGIEPLYLQFTLLSKAIRDAGPEVYVINANLPRRHLTKDKYRDLVRKLLPRVEKRLEEQAQQGALSNERASKNPKDGGVSGKPGFKDEAVKQVAGVTGKSKATVYRALADAKPTRKPADKPVDDEPAEIDGQPFSTVPVGKMHTKGWDVHRWAIELQMAKAHVRIAQDGLAMAREAAALKAALKAKRKH